MVPTVADQDSRGSLSRRAITEARGKHERSDIYEVMLEVVFVVFKTLSST